MELLFDKMVLAKKWYSFSQLAAVATKINISEKLQSTVTMCYHFCG